MSVANQLTRQAPPNQRYLELIRQFPLRPIRSKADAAAATRLLDRLFAEAADPDADQGLEDYVYVLTGLLDAWEAAHDPDHAEAFVAAKKITGLDSLKHLMKNSQTKQGDLIKILGIRASAVSMILSGERSITADHARALGKHFRVDPGIFL